MGNLLCLLRTHGIPRSADLQSQTSGVLVALRPCSRRSRCIAGVVSLFETRPSPASISDFHHASFATVPSATWRSPRQDLELCDVFSYKTQHEPTVERTPCSFYPWT